MHSDLRVYVMNIIINKRAHSLFIVTLRSFKAHFSKACHKYLAANLGRVITTDVIAALVGEAWPLSVTPLNIMSGFKKCGINPGEVKDRQLAPSKAVHLLCPAPAVIMCSHVVFSQ